MATSTPITIVGGGVAGLVASITAAEAGSPVTLYEAHSTLGGRAQTSQPPFLANLGPHVLYSDGSAWAWLAQRRLVDGRSASRAPLQALSSVRFRASGALRRMPPLAAVTALGHRGRKAPIETPFREWAVECWGPGTAEVLSNLAGVFSFDADPGRLSAAFVWERLLRVSAPKYPAVRYLRRGWGSLVDRLADRARALGVVIATSSPVDRLPEERPVIVATELASARKLLGDDNLRWEGSQVALLDVGIESRREDPFVVSDLDAPGWAERFSACDPTLAPQGHSLVQVQVGLCEGEGLEAGVSRAEQLLDVGYPDWRERERWRRRSVLRSRCGALDLPGTSWPDRPSIDRGDGVFLAGDMVAAPGLLSEVSFNSAATSARLAVADFASLTGTHRAAV